MSKGNRQKAGVKSASSQLACELLSNCSVRTTFDTFSGGCASMAETQDTISLKKLAKRDSSTREKALRELIERCTEENVDTLVSTFSYFTAQFDKMIFDCSPTVRQLSMKLVSKQVILLKKKAEKDLLNILPYIVFASCDPFTPCSTEASNFLKEVFSKDKLEKILSKLSDKIVKMLEEIVVTGDSPFVRPSTLMRNDEEDSREERVFRLSEQSYGVFVTILKGNNKEEAEKIILHRLRNPKKNEITRGLLNAVLNCMDPVSIMMSCSLFDGLISMFSCPEHCHLLSLSTDLILLLLSSPSTLNDNQRRKFVNVLLSLIKKCAVSEWDWLGIRLLPLFSSLSSLFHHSSRTNFISNWFNALQSNSLPSRDCILYVSECIKYVLALLDSPSEEEVSSALSMLFFLVSQTPSSDPSTLQSLIIWTIPRLNESKARFFLEEILRICKEKIASSSSLLESLLSLHSDQFLFAWEYLYKKEVTPLPVRILHNAPDSYLIRLSGSIDLVKIIEEEGDPFLAPLYIRLYSLLASSSFERKNTLVFSPLISSILTLIDNEGIRKVIGSLKDEDRLKCVEEWSMKEDSKSTIRLYSLIKEDEKREMEKILLSLNSSLLFLVKVAASSEMSSNFVQEISARVIKRYVTKCLNDTKAVYICDFCRLIIPRLDIPSILNLITNQVMESSTPLKVESFHSMATFFYDLIDIGMNLLEHSFFFSHILSILSSLDQELTHYSLLSYYWPLSIDIIPYRASSSSNLTQLIDGLNKALALFISLYVHRSNDSPSGTLLIPITIVSSAIRIARSSSLSFASIPETEEKILSFSQEMIESGGGRVEIDEIISLFSFSSLTSRPLLIHCLRPFIQWFINGSLPIETNTPFSALPSQGFHLHLEMARQLYYRRNADTVIETISRYSQSKDCSDDQLFTLECDHLHFSLSMSVLTGANEYLREHKVEKGKILSDANIDFLSCAVTTAINSVHSDNWSLSKWEEGKRRLLGAAAVQLAITMNDNRREEWTDFFLPSITPIILSIYSEIDIVDGSCLSRMINIFIATHSSLQWKDEWNNGFIVNKMYEMEMEQAGISPAIQTLVMKASDALEKGTEDKGEIIISACRIIGMCASYSISFSSQDEEKGINVLLPPFLRNLAIQDGWSRCAVIDACLSILSSSIRKEDKDDGIERSVLCDAMASLIAKCLTTLVSKTEQKSQDISSRYFADKPSPSRGYFIHWMAYLVRETFSSFPSIVKMWYTGLPKSASTLVNRFISYQLSSILIEHEITQVMEGNLPDKHKNDQATLAIRRHANEILMDYILEDTRMRLIIKLPIGWPLVPPSVSVEGSIVGEEDGRKWMLQLNSQLHRNASVLSALSAWLIHAGKKVEGAESCTICMMIVAPQTKQLPKARCRTCHNKFHSSCLYKWFESSNQSSCPLCRTDFTATP